MHRIFLLSLASWKLYAKAILCFALSKFDIKIWMKTSLWGNGLDGKLNWQRLDWLLFIFKSFLKRFKKFSYSILIKSFLQANKRKSINYLFKAPVAPSAYFMHRALCNFYLVLNLVSKPALIGADVEKQHFLFLLRLVTPSATSCNLFLALVRLWKWVMLRKVKNIHDWRSCCR